MSLDNEEMAMTLLRGLRLEFSSTRSLFRIQPQHASSVEAVVPPLMNREQELKEELGEEPVAFTAARAQQLQRKPFSRTLTAPQHHQQAGRSQGLGRGRGGARGTPGWNGKVADVQCWECGQWGHYSDK